MFRVKLSVVKAVLLSALALAIGACSNTPVDPTVGMSPNAIYAEAKDNIANQLWEKAIPLLEKVEARAAGTPLAQQAELDLAYAYYKSQAPAQAISTLDRFIKLHPANPALDYALYLKGLVNFNEDLGILSNITLQDLSERDQKASKESFESFKELITRFPDSKYSADAKLRMNYIVTSSAQYEVHVARYYFNRAAYLAAINRAQTVVTDYRGTQSLEEALYIMYRSYDALGMDQLRDDTKRVLVSSFPQSDFLANGFREVKSPWWKVW